MTPLETGQLHLYSASFSELADTGSWESYLHWLSEHERRRYQRLQLAPHRQRFLLVRVVLRHILSRYHQRSPDSWLFTENDYGKPGVSPDLDGPELHFNLSHSRDRLLVVVGARAGVGVDIEYSSRRRRFAGLARRYFSSEESARFKRLAPARQQRLFYQLWTLKEAYIKARGMGLTLGLQRFSFSLEEGHIRLITDPSLQDDPARWQFWQTGLGSDYQLALALDAGPGNPGQLHIWRVSALDDFEPASLEVLYQKYPGHTD